jgi:hypothetical protein
MQAKTTNEKLYECEVHGDDDLAMIAQIGRLIVIATKEIASG